MIKPVEKTNLNKTLESLHKIEKELNSYILGRKDEIHGVMIALLARQHVFFLSAPGAGKSFLSYEICRRIRSAKYFKFLMTQYTTPEDLFGPNSINALKERDEYVRITKDRLPEAFLAQLDEIWKSNPSIINTMLSIVNEREFNNGGKIVKVPLNSLIVTSNEEPPDDNVLAPMYDRILLRYHSAPLRGVAERKKVAKFNQVYKLLMSHSIPIYKWGDLISAWKVIAPHAEDKDNFDTFLSEHNIVINSHEETEEVRQSILFARDHQLNLPYRTFIVKKNLASLYEEVLKVTFPEGVEDSLYDILDRFPHVSVRRENELRTLLQAEAFYNGRDQASIEDLIILQHVLWDKSTQIDQVRSVIDEVCNTCEKELASLMDSINQEISRDQYEPEMDMATFIQRNVQAQTYFNELEELQRRFPNNPNVKKSLEEAEVLISEFRKKMPLN